MFAALQIQNAHAMPPLTRMAIVVANAIYGWEVRRLTRRKLSRLDARLLDDIGLSRTEVQAEIEKPFWRA